MSRTSKSPRMVAREAMAVAQKTLPRYSSHFSRHDFQLCQHFACLVLKSFFRTDYRGIVAILDDCCELRDELALQKLPHFTTLQKAHQRLLCLTIATQLLDATVERALGRQPAVALAAGDSTGIETSQISPYFIKRRAPKHKTTQVTTYSRYPKLELLCDCRSHIILAALPAMGPHPDVDRLRPLLIGALARGTRIGTAFFDAGYDSEANHFFARECCGVRSVIPAAAGRPSKDPLKLPQGKWRQLMRRYRDYRYGQRWQVETTISMIKRRQGGYVLGRSIPSRFAELMLKALTHNIMILLCCALRLSRSLPFFELSEEGFYRAGRMPKTGTGDGSYFPQF